MEEKTMVNDILNSCKLSLDIYQTAISEAENIIYNADAHGKY